MNYTLFVLPISPKVLSSLRMFPIRITNRSSPPLLPNPQGQSLRHSRVAEPYHSLTWAEFLQAICQKTFLPLLRCFLSAYSTENLWVEWEG